MYVGHCTVLVAKVLYIIYEKGCLFFRRRALLALFSSQLLWKVGEYPMYLSKFGMYEEGQGLRMI